MKRAVPVACGLALIASQAVSAAEYVNPKLKHHMVRAIVVLPAKVEVSKAGIKGAEPMIKESETLALQLNEIVSAILSARGMRVSNLGAASTPVVEHASSVGAFATADVQSRYDAVAVQLDRKPKDVRKGRYSLGDEITAFRPDTQADTLVFIRSSGVMLTGGKKAFGWMVAGPKTHGNLTRIALVDARSGDVLLFAVVRRAGNFLEDPERTFRKAIADAFNKHLGELAH
jgi:hypothetical protein